MKRPVLITSIFLNNILPIDHKFRIDISSSVVYITI